MADTADTARIDDSKMIYTTELLEAAVQQKRIPGAVAAVGVGTETLWTTVVGIAEVSSLPRPVTPETVYDLASLTKVLATLPAILLLAERGSLLLSDRVADFFDDFRGGEKENVTLEHLLTHTSGLPHHWYVSSYGQTRADMIRGLCAEPLEMAPGSAVVYSDLGYILLGEVIERVSGQPLDVFAER